MCQSTKCYVCLVILLSLHYTEQVFIIAIFVSSSCVFYRAILFMGSITFLLLFTTAVGICIGLSCPPKCKRKWCIQYVESKLECSGNLVKDACGCCYVCAKQINESCGGIWHAHGTCDVGLECNYSYHIPADHPATYPGVCKKKREFVLIILSLYIKVCLKHSQMSSG